MRSLVADIRKEAISRSGMACVISEFELQNNGKCCHEVFMNDKDWEELKLKLLQDGILPDPDSENIKIFDTIVRSDSLLTRGIVSTHRR